MMLSRPAACLELRQNAVAHAIPANLGHNGGRQAQPGGGRQSVAAVAAALPQRVQRESLAACVRLQDQTEVQPS